jgi:hypothetical protein
VFRGVGYRLSGDRIEIVDSAATPPANGARVIAIRDESGEAIGAHCMLEREAGGLIVVRSTQELLFVNGERVDSRRIVAVGDVVQIGECRAELQIVAVED